MATTDLHMHVLPYDYLADRPCPQRGLARTASLIAQRRAEVANGLLFDNGDFLEGNPLGDYIAEVQGIVPRQPHPAIAAMNALGYDAVALGNHDFNFGLDFLRRALAESGFPVLAANTDCADGIQFARWTMLQRVMTTEDGQEVTLKIGVIGLLPPQTSAWEPMLAGRMRCHGIRATAARLVPEMRAAGADLVVALAHTGIGPAEGPPLMDNAATALAAQPGLDVIVAGHTHQVFPGPDVAPGPGIDPRRGTLAGKPAMMAGFGGSHLGVIDLRLESHAQGDWHVAGFEVGCEPVGHNHPADQGIAAPVLHAHHATRRHYKRRIGHSDTPLSSYFSMVGDDPGLRLVNLAQGWHVRQALTGTRWDGLPVLSAAAPFRAGGRGGPDHYTDVPAGPLTLRSLADLYHFRNRICALPVSGADLRDWLERAAGAFCRLTLGGQDQRLLNPAFPSYYFDVIEGLSWQIDLSAAPRFSAAGMAMDPDGPGRIRDLRYDGRQLGDTDRFVLATNSYRLASAGLYGPLVEGKGLALDHGEMIRDVLHRYIRDHNRLRALGPTGWRFAPLPGTTALFATSPAALDRLDGLRQRGGPLLEPAGQNDQGFALLRLHL